MIRILSYLLFMLLLSIEQVWIKSNNKKKKDCLQDNTRKDGISETASAATPTTGITEVDSSGLVAQHSVLHARDDLDSASQTSDHHNSPSLGILETGNLIPPSFSSSHLNIFTLLFSLYC